MSSIENTGGRCTSHLERCSAQSRGNRSLTTGHWHTMPPLLITIGTVATLPLSNRHRNL
ncbi:hypothetical protein Hanom_Chr11g00971431 [Helianthus anomalus]